MIKSIEKLKILLYKRFSDIESKSKQKKRIHVTCLLLKKSYC